MFASFFGIGGECGPIDTAKLGSSLVGLENKVDSGDCKDSSGAVNVLVVTVLAVPEDVVDNAAIAFAMGEPVKVNTPDQCSPQAY